MCAKAGPWAAECYHVRARNLSVALDLSDVRAEEVCGRGLEGLRGPLGFPIVGYRCTKVCLGFFWWFL